MAPTTRASAAVPSTGKGSLMSLLNKNENTPAPNPLIATIASGLRALIFRVKLLSNPHSRQAPAIAAACHENPQASPGCHDKIILPAVIKPSADHSLNPIASRKTSAAMMVVATLSKFSNKDAVAAGVPDKPIMRRIGAATPPQSKARIIHGISWRFNFASTDFICILLRTAMMMQAAKPLPRYSKLAIVTGEISARSSLESGALAPKRRAANIA